MPSWVRPCAPFDAVEPLEDARQLVRRNAGAGIGDRSSTDASASLDTRHGDLARRA